MSANRAMGRRKFLAAIFATSAVVSVSSLLSSAQASYTPTVGQIDLAEFFTGTMAYGGSADCTSAVSAWITNCALTNRTGLFTGVVPVTSVVVQNINGLTLSGNGSFIGAAIGSYNAVLDFQNCSSVVLTGQINVSASYNAGYTAAVWVRTTGTGASQYFSWAGFGVNGAAIGLRVGDQTLPDAINSEHSFNFGHMFGVLQPLQIEGVETVVNTGGMVLANNLGGSGSWLTATQYTAIVIGGQLRHTGGEFQHAQGTSGACVQMQPLTSVALSGTIWGIVAISNSGVETAAPLFVTTNPGALGSPITGGLFALSNCQGAHTQDLASFLTTDSTYVGDLVLDNDCRFFKPTGGVRTNQNITCGNGGCNVFVGDNVFGKNFVQGLSGVTGGTLHFTNRCILDVSTTTQTIGNGATASLSFTGINNTGDLARFSPNYSAPNFTIPAGGFASATVLATLFQSGVAGLTLILQVNGSNVAQASFTAGGQAIININGLAAGTTITPQLNNASGGSVTLSGGGLDRFQMFANN